MKYYRRFALGLLALAYLLLLGARVEYLLYAGAQETLPRHVGETALVVGRVVAEPDKRDASLRLTIAVQSINNEPASGVLLAVVPPNATALYNDTVEVSGQITTPESFVTDTGRIFDYAGYLRVRGVSATMTKTRLVSDTPGGWSLLGPLFALKQSFERSLENIFSPPQSALLEGILLGERRGLSPATEQALVAAGLIHIVILAGYALSIVSQGVLDAFSIFRPRVRYTLAVAALVLFVLMTGAAATTVRACLMAVIAMVARILHRHSVAMRSLAVVAGAMLLWNPLFIFDESFVISVLATFGLITLAPLCERWLGWLPEKFDVRGIAASTLAVQIFALPALLYFTGTLSLYALPANLLALPALPWVMLFGFAAGILGLIHPLLALVPAVLASLLMNFILLVAGVAASLPLGGAAVPPFPVWLTVLVYLPLIFAALRTYFRTPTN